MFETAANCVNFVRLGINKLVGMKLEWIDGLKILFLMCFSFIYHCHVQDLTSQVSAETDPVSLLAKVVSLLYIQVS